MVSKGGSSYAFVDKPMLMDIPIGAGQKHWSNYILFSPMAGHVVRIRTHKRQFYLQVQTGEQDTKPAIIAGYELSKFSVWASRNKIRFYKFLLSLGFHPNPPSVNIKRVAAIIVNLEDSESTETILVPMYRFKQHSEILDKYEEHEKKTEAKEKNTEPGMYG